MKMKIKMKKEMEMEKEMEKEMKKERQASGFYIVGSAITGAGAVALGAMGAHVWKDALESARLMEVWKTAASYHLIHAVLILLLTRWQPFPERKWWIFFLGILIFSGSLYVLCLSGIRWMGAITPVGGLLLILGWVTLAFEVPRKRGCE